MASPLARALTRRGSLTTDSATTAYRLLNRRGDGFPSLAVDRLGEVLVAHVYGAGHRLSAPTDTLEALAQATGARSVYVKYRPTQANVLSESERQALAPTTPLLGEPVEETVAQENGLRFAIRPADGLSVGLFLDMRELRAWVRAQARGQTVLNCFAYTCGFGVAAVAGGAARTVNVDVSKKYLAWGQHNLALNGFTPDPHDFISGDVFDWLKRFQRQRQTFDVVILDPPSYSTTRRTRFSLARDYAALVALAARVTAPGGWLLACANAAELPLKTFQAKVRAGLDGHRAEWVRTLHEPDIDFPVALGERAYLKVGLVRVESEK